MKVREIMHSPVSVESSVSVKQAATEMKKRGIGSLLVCTKGKNCGIITERDILNRVVAEGVDATKTSVEKVMTKKLVTIDADEDIEKALDLMHGYHIRRLVVMDGKNGKEIAGVITSRDVAKNVSFQYARKLHEENYARPEYFVEREK